MNKETSVRRRTRNAEQMQLFQFPPVPRRQRFRVGLTPGQLELFQPTRIRRSDLLIKEALNEYYSAEVNFCIPPTSGEPFTIFRDGTRVTTCSNWAAYVRRIEGNRAELHGFLDEENPLSEIASDVGGHDFAVLDNRFIIDGWLPNVCCYHERAVFDLQDPRDAEIIWSLYGPPSVWLGRLRNRQLENSVDKEDADDRAAAMEGVIPRPPLNPDLIIKDYARRVVVERTMHRQPGGSYLRVMTPKW